jgi:hypothetical protein
VKAKNHLARTRSALCNECHNEVTRHKLSCATGYELRAKLDEMKAAAKSGREFLRSKP